MTDLTGKQKRFLRGLGQKLPAAVQVGKAGRTDNVTAAVADALDRAELVKVRLPALPPADRKELAGDLADAVGAAVAGSVGRTVLLYRPNHDIAPDARLALPE